MCSLVRLSVHFLLRNARPALKLHHQPPHSHSSANVKNYIMTSFKRLFRSRKNVASPTPSASSSVQAPAPEDDAQHDPPPYTASSTTQPDGNIPLEVALSQDTQPQGLLDPNLNFTAAQMEQQWRAKDKLFARAIVQFVAERFDGNLKGWAGYRYTYVNEVCSLKHLYSTSIYSVDPY